MVEPKIIRKLVLVENQIQAKTLDIIFKQLSKNIEEWLIISTNSHISYITPNKPLNELFELNWIFKTTKVLKIIKENIIKADYVYIITSDNREGEELAYHLQDLALTYGNARIYRLYINNLTIEEIKQALNTKINISDNIVFSHRAFLSINYLINNAIMYSLKHIFDKQFSINYLSMFILNEIIKKEYEFRTQQKETFYQIEARTYNKAIAYSDKFLSYEEAEKLLYKITNLNILTDYFIKKQEIHPLKPFNTATLINYIANKYKFNIQYIIEILQNLYSQGLISFFYTTSTFLNKFYAYDIWDFLKTNNFLMLAENPQYYKKFGKAIVPTDIANLPEHIALELDTDNAEVYKIIWYRTIYTQYSPIFLHRQQVDYYLEKDEKTLLSAEGMKIKLKGWLQEDNSLFFKKIQFLDENNLEIEHAMIRTYENQKNKNQYTQASLIKWMHKEKICRPEDFISTLDYLETHKYIKIQNDNIITPTVSGEQVIEFLKYIVPEILNKKFILDIKNDIDNIENYKYYYKDVVKKYNRWCLKLKKKERKKLNTLCTICENNLYTLNDNNYTWCEHCD